MRSHNFPFLDSRLFKNIITAASVVHFVLLCQLKLFQLSPDDDDDAGTGLKPADG
jgi:hypothetical protein